MPGPVSDSYHPEFGTGEAAGEFREHLERLHRAMGGVIGAPAVDYRTLPARAPGQALSCTLPERDWRFIRYALEVAIECV